MTGRGGAEHQLRIAELEPARMVVTDLAGRLKHAEVFGALEGQTLEEA
jgi:hypothetical protein